MEIDYDEERVPAPTFAAGDRELSDAEKQHTTLSEYLKYDTWPPHWAAMLVCGLQPILPPHDTGEIPNDGTFSLGGTFVGKRDDPMIQAARVLSLWESQVDAPKKVRPRDFLAWCMVKGINTDWLRGIAGSAVRAVPGSTPSTAPSVQDWKLKEPKVADQFRSALFELLKSIHAEGKPCPTPTQVFELWRGNEPACFVRWQGRQAFVWKDGLGIEQPPMDKGMLGDRIQHLVEKPLHKNIQKAPPKPPLQPRK